MKLVWMLWICLLGLRAVVWWSVFDVPEDVSYTQVGVNRGLEQVWNFGVAGGLLYVLVVLSSLFLTCSRFTSSLWVGDFDFAAVPWQW